MTLEVTSKDCAGLGDAELAEMADMTSGTVDWEVGQLSKQAEEWVLVTTASRRGRLMGFAFTTLERIGGTPAMVIGVAATAVDRSSSATMRAIMREQYHRALMAFPDEDVLVAACVDNLGALEVLDKLGDVCPADGVRANGEERAWGRRLSKRFGVAEFDDRTMRARAEAPALVVDHRPSADVDDQSELFAGCEGRSGEFVVAWGWAMAEFLETFR